jgi:hypothetical protein
VPAAAVVGSGSRLYLIPLPTGTVRAFPRTVEGEELPRGLIDALGRLEPALRVVALEPTLARTLPKTLGRPVVEATRDEWRSARARLPPPDPAAERSYLLAVAHATLERALRAPDEILITLAREEERVERALGREQRAAEAFVRVPHSPIEEYRVAWEGTRAAVRRHHGALRATVEAEARVVLPNLSAVVGARTAARLLASAGGLAALGRMRAPRLQLLGSRRRPSAERGPRYGLLFRADRMDEVPLSRKGAYARSLAALASIAARADATTRADVSARLLVRRDRRVAELTRRRR